MTKSPSKSKGKELRNIETNLADTNEKAKDRKSSTTPRKVTLSSEADLYFHTQAADDISDQLQHNRLYRAKFAKRFFDAIHEGQITAYDHRDGFEIEAPIPFQRPLCVKVDEVNLWLKNNTLNVYWNPKHGEGSTQNITLNEQHESRHSTDYRKLATRDELTAVFGKFTGMELSWFKNLKDSPALLAARIIIGIGGRRHIEPLFCPYMVMLWLINPKRKKGKPLSEEKGWELLAKHFPHAYDPVSQFDPRETD